VGRWFRCGLRAGALFAFNWTHTEKNTVSSPVEERGPVVPLCARSGPVGTPLGN